MPIKVFNTNTKDSMWDRNKRPCYFFELFGHLIKYSSEKMIESGQGTLNQLPYANINIKFAISCAFRGKPAMKTYQGYTDIMNELMVTYPMFGEFQPTNSCIKIRHIWVFPCNGIFPSNLYFSIYAHKWYLSYMDNTPNLKNYTEFSNSCCLTSNQIFHLKPSF